MSLSMPNGSVYKFTSPGKLKWNGTIGESVEEGGFYSCLATNDVGIEEDNVTIYGVRCVVSQVDNPMKVVCFSVIPSVYLIIKPRDVTIGDTFTVSCRGSGYPRPSLSLSISNGSVYNFTSPTEFKFNVTIGGFDKGGGVYSCSSTNTVGASADNVTVFGVCVCYYIDFTV